MKILHTADWHLGQKFLNQERREEHQKLLNWILDLLVKEEIEILIVAGDIFDVSNPPNYARRMYFQFLRKIKNTPCKQVVIIAGNHDSPNMLDAPKELLEEFSVSVVARVSENPSEQIIFYPSKENPKAIIAAVPFLRDSDLDIGITDDSSLNRFERIRIGIKNHYHWLADAIDTPPNVPLITTGHLFATGAITSAKHDNIYVGNIENISASAFPSKFDYVALGHIHKAQRVSKQEHIRYSGSPLPLSFGEIEDRKVVNIIHFEGKKLKEVSTVEVPTLRRLVRISGDFANIKKELATLVELHQSQDLLPSWVEINYKDQQQPISLVHDLNKLVENQPVQLLKIKSELKNKTSELDLNSTALEELDQYKVFDRLLEENLVPKQEALQLTENYKSLLYQIQQEDEE